jgi:hypothetical protein
VGAEWRNWIGRTDDGLEDLGGEALRCPSLRFFWDDADMRSSPRSGEALQLSGKPFRLGKVDGVD